jgi:hypothetical protein
LGTELRDLRWSLLWGLPGPVTLTVAHADGTRADVATERVADPGGWSLRADHREPGPFRRLSDDLAYLTLGTARAADIASYLAGAEGADLVVDLRNYPIDEVSIPLASHLVTAPARWAKFLVPDFANPGAFPWEEGPLLRPERPHFSGRVALLVDEETQSAAEYATMALRLAPDAVVVGSNTAGADGNIAEIPLPGQERTSFSGLGVFYPDGTATQRIGLRPDVVVRPTVAGIAAGRDEVFDAAVVALLGRGPTDAEREALDP